MIPTKKRGWLEILLVSLPWIACVVFLVALWRCDVHADNRALKMAKDLARAEYRCSRVRVEWSDRDNWLYEFDVCGARRWYRCRGWLGLEAESCDEVEKK